MISLTDLRAKDLDGFQQLLLRAFKRLGYSVWLSEKLDGKTARSILLKGEERCLVQCSQEKGLVDKFLIEDFCRDREKKGIESGFFITTGAITLSDRTYLSSEPVDFIDASQLPTFLKTIFGEDGLKKEVTSVERREFPRVDLRGLEGDKVLWRVNTFYGMSSPIKGELADISSGGIGFESPDEISPSSLLRLELFLYGSREAIKSVAKIVWEKPRTDSLVHNFGLSFFLISDKDKERISDFIVSQLSRESRETRNGLESEPEFLSRLLIKENIIGRTIPDVDDQKNRETRRMDEVDIKKCEASVKRFFKKMFSEKCKILEVSKTATGWEILAKKIDGWFKKKGYREVYEKVIYVVKLDDKFKVLSYSKVGSDCVPKNNDLITSQSVNADKIREIVKEVAKEISGGSESNIDQDILRKIAAETVDEMEKRKGEEVLQKKKGEEIEIKESYISPLKSLKLERSFNRIGTVRKSKKDIKSQVDSLMGVKKGRARRS